MGAISSAVSGITSAVSAVKDVATFVEDPAKLDPFNTSEALLAKQQSLALQQLQAKQSVDMANATANANLQQQELAATADAQTQSRQTALKAAVARQRAAFGADGLDASGGGSADAVLLGLASQSDQEQADQDRIDSLKSAAIGQGLTDQSNIDVLQRAQLMQQQKLAQAAEGF